MDWISPFRELFGFFLPFLESVPAIRAILGFSLVFFLPGFAWTFIFFKSKSINVIERVALSFGLSMAVVTLSIFALNVLFGTRITGLNSVLVIIAIIIIPVVFYYLNRLIRSRLLKSKKQSPDTLED